MENIFISIIIPAYNESKRIGKTLRSLSNYFGQTKFNYEIIVVDDGSIDTTKEVALQSAHLFKNFRVIQNEQNRGKGYSIKLGFENAIGTFQIFMDADNSVDIHNLDKFLEEAKDADLVIGSIALPGAFTQDENFRYRRPLGKFAKILIRYFITPGIFDTQRGFKLFSKKSAEVILKQLTIKRWGFDIELIAIAQAKGFLIKEIPVRWINPKTTSLTFSDFFSTFLEMIKIKVNMIRRKYD